MTDEELERLDSLRQVYEASCAAIRPERRDLFVERTRAGSIYLNVLYEHGEALIAEVRAARSQGEGRGEPAPAFWDQRVPRQPATPAAGAGEGGAEDAIWKAWRALGPYGGPWPAFREAALAAQPTGSVAGWREEVEAELRRLAAQWTELERQRSVAGDMHGRERCTPAVNAYTHAADLVRDGAPPSPAPDASDEGGEG